jgi:hypothetical protein
LAALVHKKALMFRSRYEAITHYEKKVQMKFV